MYVESVSTATSGKFASSPEPRKHEQPRRKALKTEPKHKRTALLGVRVTETELELWDANNVKTGQLRSAVLRKKLGIGIHLPNKRPDLSKEAAYDYHRAMIIRMSVDKILLALESILTLEDQAQKEEALSNIVLRVKQETKKIKQELDALQLRAGICRLNPVVGQSSFDDEIDADDCNSAH